MMGNSDPVSESPMFVTLDQIRAHEVDVPNLQFQEIKESIRVGGLHRPLTITRRPGDDFYILEAGGGTRYQALADLWKETGDKKYHRILVIFRPRHSEGDVLLKHMAENLVRGDSERE